jgi:hypothetical protein
LLFAIFFKLFPSLAMWEVEEGEEIEERKRIAEKSSLQDLKAIEKT